MAAASLFMAHVQVSLLLKQVLRPSLWITFKLHIQASSGVHHSAKG
ncbi:hypothetical protein OHAE_5394 [Ochrobactrum soli]|uniref:Uncharacterized protein n=1 Tax=Ochrobactrum soli TaxID=2448455 RepID=A0A2P9HDZ6_9HYPH|nr:hypothetical protein OHAE_5394 [[Ochrobactrum] soli]